MRASPRHARLARKGTSRYNRRVRPGAQRYGSCIFVSYSHADRKWLERIKAVLKGYRVYEQLWLDPYIQVGDRWEREIDGALGRASIGLLLMSSSFFGSDFIKAREWPALRDAVQSRGLRIFCVPVSSTGKHPRNDFGLDAYQWARPPQSPIDLMSEGEQNRALVEMADGLQDLWDETADTAAGTARGTEAGALELAGQGESVPGGARVRGPLKPLSRGGGKAAAVLGAPVLPPHFVHRGEELEALKRSLLDTLQQRFGISGMPSSAKAGLHGQGGIGKTVLATALVLDDDVRANFGDGIYWLTLGQEPNAFELLRQLAEMLELKDELKDELRDAGSARRALREHLQARRCLLVLDDVWQAAHAEALDLLGPHGRTLITSRDELLLKRLGAATERIAAMAPEPARQLLARWAQQAVETLPAVADEVAQRCAHLPLALALAGAQVNEGSSWDDVRAALEAGDLEFLDHPHGSIFKSLGASIRALPADEAERYRQLAVFPEDAPVPEEVIIQLWAATGLSRPRARRLLRRLAARSLLRLSSGSTPVVTFHDLQGDYLRLIAPDLPTQHGELLDAYFATLSSERPAPYRWSSLPPDAHYLWRHFAHHMRQAGRLPQLQQLVCDVPWLQAKLAATGVASVEYDLQALLEAAPTEPIAQLERALRLESGWLHQDPAALPSLLYNRLRADGLSAQAIEELLHDLPPLPLRLRHPVYLGAEQRTLRGHSLWVMSCVLSSDGTVVVSASVDRTAKVWDARTGQERCTLRGHSGPVFDCALSHDGTTVVSASADKTLKVWDIHTGQERATLRGHSAAVNGCAVSADGETVVSASADKTLKVWDVRAGRERLTLRGHADVVNDCVLSADDGTIASASSDGAVKVWELLTGRGLLTLRGHSEPVNACALSADGTTLVSASADGTLKIWDLGSGQQYLTLRGHSGQVFGCALSTDGSTVVSASDDDTLKVWDARTGRERLTLPGDSGVLFGCALSADGETVVSASLHKTLKVWDFSTFEERRGLRGHAARVRGCALSGDSATAVSASSDKTLRVWDVRTGQERLALRGHLSRVNACAVSGDGMTVVSASDDKTLRVWDLGTGKERLTLRGHAAGVKGCALSWDGMTSVSASNDRTLKVWDLRTGEERLTLRGHLRGVRGCALSTDAGTAVSASADSTLKLWDLRTGEERRTLRGHLNGVHDCILSGDGTLVVSASVEGTLKVWDAGSGQERATLRGHSGPIVGCALSADGTAVVSAGSDHTLRLWDVHHGQCLFTVYGAGPFDGLAVGPRIVVAGDALGNVWMLDWALNVLRLATATP